MRVDLHTVAKEDEKPDSPLVEVIIISYSQDLLPSIILSTICLLYFVAFRGCIVSFFGFWIIILTKLLVLTGL